MIVVADSSPLYYLLQRAEIVGTHPAALRRDEDGPSAGNAQAANDGPEVDGVVIGGRELRHLAQIRPWT